MPDIHPTAVVQDGATLADDVFVGPFCTVGAKVTLGAGVRLISHVVVEGVTRIGEGTTVHPFAVLGGAPQHLGHKGEDTELVIGARNTIREHVTMHTGTVSGRGVTRVGNDGLFMVGIHIAHDCIVGDSVVMANNATLGGHITVGDFVFMGGLSAVHQFCSIGRYAFVGGMAAVNGSVIPYGSVWGNHAHLEGLNLIGLKRRGFSRDTIRDMRTAFRLLFAEEGAFQERIDDAARVYANSPEVMEIIDFVRAEDGRKLTLPQREV
jgi:UDP-N-acetylglucosamine acyltransferase